MLNRLIAGLFALVAAIVILVIGEHQINRGRQSAFMPIADKESALKDLYANLAKLHTGQPSVRNNLMQQLQEEVAELAKLSAELKSAPPYRLIIIEQQIQELQDEIIAATATAHEIQVSYRSSTIPIPLAPVAQNGNDEENR